jgi:hypothetical protein
MKVYVIGAGPGDPSLLTGLAKERLAQCGRVLTSPRLASRLGHLNPHTTSCPVSEMAARVIEAGPDGPVGCGLGGTWAFTAFPPPSKKTSRRFGGH